MVRVTYRRLYPAIALLVLVGCGAKLTPASATQIRAEDGKTMVYVSAGTFLMGSTENAPDAKDDEKPQRTVYLDAFWIDQTEVTNALYGACVEAGQCTATTTCDWGDPTFFDIYKADHPVVCVRWQDAKDYCTWVRARLPTEAEWEKAARGTDGRIYPWGDDFDCRKGNFDDEQGLDTYVVPGSPNCDGYMLTAPVGSFPSGASPYGALDMAGNVWEWVADWYDSTHYSDSVLHNPEGPLSGEHRVIRGGSWFSNAPSSRAAQRDRYLPTYSRSRLGFRCAASLLP